MLEIVDGIRIYDERKVEAITGKNKADLRKAVRTLEDITLLGNSKGLAKDYAAFKKYVPTLIKAYFSVCELNDDLVKTIEEYEGKTSLRTYKKWTPEEDELLIELAGSENKISQTELSTRFGRSPAAITSRLSKLVGIGRVSQEIAGKFIGKLNGETVNGYVQGTVFKQANGGNHGQQ